MEPVVFSVMTVPIAISLRVHVGGSEHPPIIIATKKIIVAKIFMRVDSASTSRVLRVDKIFQGVI